MVQGLATVQVEVEKLRFRGLLPSALAEGSKLAHLAAKTLVQNAFCVKARVRECCCV
jgi:hypothetical protein